MDNTIIKELAERAAKAEALLLMIVMASEDDVYRTRTEKAIRDAAVAMGWRDLEEVKKDAETKLD